MNKETPVRRSSPYEDKKQTSLQSGQGWTRKTYAKVLEQSLGVLVDLKLARVGVLGEVEGRHLGDVLVLALTLLLLKLEGDTADGTLLDTLHQVSGIAGNLVSSRCQFSVISRQKSTQQRRAKMLGASRVKIYLVAETLGCNNGNLIADALVGLEVKGELGVVPLNDDLGGLLDGLGANATHFGGG